MDTEKRFVDYYSALDAHPNFNAKRLEAAYRHLARMYHPDHPETADVTKFQATIEAYEVLRNAEKRAEYDGQYKQKMGARFHQASEDDEIDIDEKHAISDAEAQERILFYLYKRRREHAQEPGVVGYYLQELLECSDDLFEFYLWYLKAKGFISGTEQGTLAITIEGVDHVMSLSRAIEAETFLLPKHKSTEQ